MQIFCLPDLLQPDGIFIHGRRFDRSLYDASAWRKYGWDIFNQGVREKIRSDFSGDLALKRHMMAIEFYSLVEQVNGEFLTRLHPKRCGQRATRSRLHDVDAGAG